jgi:hypothetical protein
MGILISIKVLFIFICIVMMMTIITIFMRGMKTKVLSIHIFMNIRKSYTVINIILICITGMNIRLSLIFINHKNSERTDLKWKILPFA